MTIVILAGGKSLRMGKDKLLLTTDSGLTLTEDAVRRFQPKFERVLLSVNDPERFADLDIAKVADNFPNCGPIGGLQSALSLTGGDVFLVAADMPFANADAAKRVIELCRDCAAGAVIRSDGKFEPLFAFYSYSVLPVVNSMITEGLFKMNALLSRVETRRITPQELGDLWSGKLLSNINRPADYERLITKSDSLQN
ncbi:MAG: molybdenum cofactor guanylyltransferase [Oscillospiraceae bacterium]|jgi:molybdopterin-guanine dinucleotide biosynthesis protein A|nr:molybdenum cofactor guanylyltransferase [Oscillospiraceae bacterium]